MEATLRAYDDAALEKIEKGARRRLIQLGVFVAILLAAALALFFLRLEFFTILLTILGGSALIFWWDFAARGDVAYRKKIRGALTGLRHSVDLTFVFAEPEPVLRDGAAYIRWILRGGDGEERYLYWDARLPQPALSEGDRLIAEHAGNEILSYAILRN